jgi:hypothetical protein
MAFFISQTKLESEISKRAAEACDQIISEMGAELHDDLIQKLSIFRLISTASNALLPTRKKLKR